MTNNQKDINYLLIDGTSYLYRSYYSFPFLNNKIGIPSGAIYGVINMLNKLLFKYPKTQIIIVFDSPFKTFRHKLFKFYKSNRPIMPIKLQVQIKPLHQIIKMMGFPIVLIPHFEADDIIGTLSCEANNNNKFTLISTNDKDLAQLVNTNINILENKSNKILGKKEIISKYGITPELIPDLLGLMGDKSDNIPGVPKIGKKIALFLLREFKSLKNIYKNIEKIPKCLFRGAKNITESLIKNESLAFLSKNLATIKTDILTNISINKLKMSKPSIYRLSHLFKYYEFHNWSKLLEKGKWTIHENYLKK
ncbi:MAG: 5'-3' exonuclease H3TH domain-containing protein [Buchnera aphidicola (Floraphis choui)]